MKNEVDAYIAAAPKAAQPRLRQIRQIIRREAPKADESISYGMPYYSYKGKLMYFAAFKHHISLFPVGNADKHLEMSPYTTGKGTYQFPIREPLPVGLIRRLVSARVKENERAAAERAPARSSRGR